MSASTIGVLGLGLFGSAVARTLAKNNVDVLAIDKNMDHVEEVLDEVSVAVQGDFTKLDHLMDAGFSDCDEVIIAAAEKLEDSIMAILNLKRMGINTITAKTKNEDYREVLIKVGATRVILPEVEIGVQLGIMLANPTVHELLKLDNHYNIVEFPYHPTWVGRSIVDIDFRNQYQTNIIAIQPAKTNEFTIEFGPNYVISEGDVFLGITTDDAVKKLVN